MGVFIQVISNIKGFARKFACKSAYASCVNGTFGVLCPVCYWASYNSRCVQATLLLRASATHELIIRNVDSATTLISALVVVFLVGPYDNWLFGTPDNLGEEDCMVKLASGEWNNVPCSFTRVYVCEKGTVITHV